MTGALLGVAHLVLRPVLRLLSAPLGCLTLGLFGLVIDVGLIYACGSLVEGFTVPGPLYAVLTAVLINVICAVAGAEVGTARAYSVTRRNGNDKTRRRIETIL